MCRRYIYRLRILAWLLVALTAFSCAHSKGGAGATLTPRPICFTRGEALQIEQFKIRAKAKIKRLGSRLTSQAKTHQLDREKDKRIHRARLKACHQQWQNAAARRCPSCAWKILGAAGIGIVVGVLGGVIVTFFAKK